MSRFEKPLIVGAGPVGLAAALFLARQGIAARVVEMRNEPLAESRALAANPRTLELLEPTGLTQRMLELGLPIREARFYRGRRVVGGVSLAGLRSRYPFMLAISQATTERLLVQALEVAGGTVERGTKLVWCRTVADGVEAAFEPSEGGSPQAVRGPWLLAADGAHSAVRQSLAIPFDGPSFVDDWHLVDVRLRTELADDCAHAFFLDEGEFVFLIRVVDDVLDKLPGPPVWRVIGNRAEPLSRLIDGQPAGLPLWASNFRVAHRIAATLAQGNVYLAGDAAHIHSPVGARGMNLGIEDAWVFARLVQSDRLAMYNTLRRPVDEKVVRQVRRFSAVVGVNSPLNRLLRRLLPVVVGIRPLKARMMAMLTGLDHQLSN
jgi:2-polyprenyl-6-methoxyphenol hydroxylase-like FAD-dependent oxidoreductase